MSPTVFQTAFVESKRSSEDTALNFQNTLATADTGCACAYGFQNLGASDCFEERVEFFGGACDFDGVAAVCYIDNAATVDFGQSQEFVAVFADGADFYQHQLAFDKTAFVQIDHFDNFNQFVELFGDLLDNVFVAMGNDGHARQGFVFGWRNSQGVDVVIACGEQTYHTAHRT